MVQNDIKDLSVQIYYNSNLIRRDICRSDDYELINLNNHIIKLNEQAGTDLNSVVSLLSAQTLQQKVLCEKYISLSASLQQQKCSHDLCIKQLQTKVNKMKCDHKLETSKLIREYEIKLSQL